MSDIPIGSPPVPPGRHAAPGGWYADPVDATRERYWDGWQWTRSTRVAEVPGTPAGWPPPERTAAPPPPYPPAPPADPRAAGRPAYPGGPVYAGAPVPARYPPTGPVTADGVPLAGWWWRVLAVLIDGLLVGVLALLPTAPFLIKVTTVLVATFTQVADNLRAGLPPPPTPTTVLSPLETVAYVAITLGVAAAYQIGFLRRYRATPGKLALGLRVVPVDQGRVQGPMPWRTAGIRTAVWLAPGLGNLHPALSLLAAFRLFDVLLPLWHPRRQTVHDLAARTQVVKIH